MTLHLETTGSGPAIVFLHGTPTTVDVFDGIVASLSASHTCHVVHMPGYGKSPAPTLPVSFDRLYDELAGTLGALGTEPFTLAGTSGGAWHALALALRGVLPVARVALFAGLADLSAQERDGFRQFASALRAGADLRSLAAPRFLSSAAQQRPALRAAVEAWLEATPPEVLASELEAFAAAPDLLVGLSSLSLPILACVGGADAATPVAKSEAIAASSKAARLVVLPDVGHALTLEDPARCVNELHAFV